MSFVLPDDCRKWAYYVIEMPVTSDGQGPATVGVDAASMTYEVWDVEFYTWFSYDNLPDAINLAMNLKYRDPKGFYQ